MLDIFADDPGRKATRTVANLFSRRLDEDPDDLRSTMPGLRKKNEDGVHPAKGTLTGPWYLIAPSVERTGEPIIQLTAPLERR